MGKHILFLTHGMGNHIAGEWETPIIEKLCSTFQKYSIYKKEHKELDEFIDFVPITYDNIFRDKVTSWQNNFDSLSAEASLTGQFNPLDLMNWLAQAGESEKNFFWTHIVDVLIYRFFPNETQMVRMTVLNQIKERLKQETTEPACSILAHSLGTSVMHDSLHLLYSTPWGDKPNYFQNQFKFQAIIMLANTSRVLTNDVPETGQFYDKIYSSLVKPGSCVLNYLNCRNQYDPIPSWVYRFSPSWVVDNHFQNILINHVSQINVHDYLHYLENPSVHIPIFRSVFGKFAITQTEAEQKQTEFNTTHTLNLQNVNPGLYDLFTKNTEATLTQNIRGFIELLQAYSSTLS